MSDARCASCGGPLEAGQRYCLACGARRVSLPAIFTLLHERIGPKAPPREPAPPPGREGEAQAEEGDPLGDLMPTPQAAAVAVMALLAFGVIVGSLGNQVAQSAGLTTITIGRTAAAPQPAPAPEPVVEEVEAPAPAPAPAPPVAPPQPLEAPAEEAPAEPAPQQAPPELPPEPGLPPVSHAFLIVLGEGSYEQTFGAASQSAYFSQTLPAKGELLSNYYAVAEGGLANQIALVSGQGPTPQTAADCPEYADIAPGSVGLAEQVEGGGCVYPPETTTLPGQLVTAKKSWKAYVEENGAPGQPASCSHTWRNPFAYFHSLLDGGECEAKDVGIGQLAADLRSAKKTPALSYIVPGPCHDGSEAPCAPGAPAGLAGAEAFLAEVLPEIEGSEAYATGGLIAITFAQAPQEGPAADHSSCCATPEYPNLTTPGAPPPPPAEGPIKPTGGGGRVGMLLISPYVLPGSVNETGYYNHYSTLHSIEELFGLPTLAYAAEPAVTAFDETVYNNLES